MFEPDKFHVVETLPDGTRVDIRAQKPEDREAILGEMQHASADTLYHRFFAVKRALSPKEEHFFFDIDFIHHVVLIATTEMDGKPRIIGGARFVETAPGKAEVAFSVVDDYQGHGLGAILMRHITTAARASGVSEFVAEVLTDNAPMLAVFEHAGLIIKTRREGSTIHVSMRFPDA